MNSVLVGLDGSPRQEAVLRSAVDLAQKLSAPLTLFRAVSLPVRCPSPALAIAPDKVGPLLIESAKRHLEEIAASIPKGLSAKMRVELGTPWRALVDAARQEKASLIIIGSHGYSGVDHLLGTTAAKVVNHAGCSVLVVR